MVPVCISGKPTVLTPGFKSVTSVAESCQASDKTFQLDSENCEYRNHDCFFLTYSYLVTVSLHPYSAFTLTPSLHPKWTGIFTFLLSQADVGRATCDRKNGETASISSLSRGVGGLAFLDTRLAVLCTMTHLISQLI